MTLTEFLAARLDEDAGKAEGVHSIGCGLIAWDGTCNCGWPTRVLREVEAGRKILKHIMPELVRWRGFVDSEYNSYPDWDETDLLKMLAAVYSDHPDYDPAWSETDQVVPVQHP